MPTRRLPRALLPKACIICGQEWTPQTSKQAREKQTCSAACAGAASGRTRQGTHQAKTSNPAGRACTRCGVFKGWSQFAWKTVGQDRTCWCRTCARAYNREYRARYRQSINAEHRRATAQGRWHRGPQSRMRQKWRKVFERQDRQADKTRRCARLVGVYFRDYARWCAPAERSSLYLQARMILAWLLRSHAWMSPEQIGAALRTEPRTALWYVACVRRAIRDRPPRSSDQGRCWSVEATATLKGHAQELLRRAEGHPAGSLEPLAQPHEHEEHPEPSALDVYWRRSRRRAAAERTQSYG